MISKDPLPPVSYDPTAYYPITVNFSVMIADMIETVGPEETLKIAGRAIGLPASALTLMLGHIVYQGRTLRAGDRRRVRAAINKAMEI